MIHAFNGYEITVPLAIGIDFNAMSAVDREVYKFHSVWWVDEIELR
ncbi:MAG: hypothetical protein ACOCWX_04730 [Spirochaetota bacterium]